MATANSMHSSSSCSPLMGFSPIPRCSATRPLLCFSSTVTMVRTNERKKKQRVTSARRRNPSANERAKVLEGVAKVRCTWRDNGGKVSCRGSAALSSLYTHGYNILMKERPDRAKCPRRLALPNCSVPRPSDGFHPSLGSEHAPAIPPLIQ